jgi:phosphoglycolate phosphatase-like HAD superfamily hydrolase
LPVDVTTAVTPDEKKTLCPKITASLLATAAMLRIITDFDGPIMDVSERYYQVYLLCLQQTQLPGQEITILTKPVFWALKRSQVPEIKIGLMSGLDAEQAAAFNQRRKQQVHQLDYMKFDRLIPTAIAALTKIQAHQIDLVVMTMRRVKELDIALEQGRLEHFFPLESRYCLSNDYIKTQDVQDKPLLMASAMAELPPASQTWMVGDTEADIAAAHSQAIPIIAVLSGIRDQTNLEKYQPHSIVADLATAVDQILATT